jgi:hypothetical protein
VTALRTRKVRLTTESNGAGNQRISPSRNALTTA